MIKKKSGFTLIEMMIVLFIIVIVLGIVNSMFMTGNRIFNDSDVKSTLQMEAKDIQEAISNIGMEGSEILDINYFKDTTDVNKIFLKSFKDDSEQVFLLEHKNDDGKNKFQISIITIKDNKEDEITRENLKKYDEKFIYDRKSTKVFSEHINHMEIISVNGKEEFDKSNKDKLKEIYSIKLKVVLKEKKGFADIRYPFEFTVTLRNRGLS